MARALVGLEQEETLVVIISKTFTTAETRLNARTVRKWLTASLGDDCVPKHMVAVSTNKTVGVGGAGGGWGTGSCVGGMVAVVV